MTVRRYSDMSCLGGSPQLGGTVPRWREESSSYATLRPVIPFLFLFPRSKDKLWEDGKDRGQNATPRKLLPSYRPCSPDYDQFADIEGRFYIDIATMINNAWKAQRKLTAGLMDQDYQPVPGRAIEFRRTGGSAYFKFVTSGGTEVDELTGSNAPITDERGLVEVTVRHPPREVPPSEENVSITASAGTDEDTIILRLVRNSESPNLDDVARKSSRNADRLYVYQPDPAQRTPEALWQPNQPQSGVMQLQEILNEVVSRNRRVPASGTDAWAFIRLDNVYSDATKKAVKLYLEHFATINTPANWPYNLSQIGLSNDLVEYLKTEYLFDPTIEPHRGWIVDRRILIGGPRNPTQNDDGQYWDLTPSAIDGLWELYEGVVERLKTEMVRMGELYVNENTFWLHRPIHQPYTQSPNRVWRIRQDNVTVRSQSNAASPPLQAPGPPEPDGTPTMQDVVLNSGEVYPLVGNGAAVNGFRPIVHTAGNGWVPNASGAEFRDDQSLERNSGLHGMNGVAYSFGCKCRPDEYAADLMSNPHALPADNSPRRRIADWAEYENEHKPGLNGTSQQNPNPPPAMITLPTDNTANWTGCDCSGFTQNCITESLFAGTDVRVVPNSMMRRLTRSASTGDGRVHQNAIGSGGFVGHSAFARPVSLPQHANQYDHSRHWIRRGDLIAGGGHIVWIEPEIPQFVLTPSGAIAMGEQSFLTYNERGDTQDYDDNFQARPFAQRRFTRKAVLQPFRWWGPAINQRDIGKPYIWH
jgi:hypothetical protein